jgi:hypothetical protein
MEDRLPAERLCPACPNREDVQGQECQCALSRGCGGLQRAMLPQGDRGGEDIPLRQGIRRLQAAAAIVVGAEVQGAVVEAEVREAAAEGVRQEPRQQARQQARQQG